MIKSILKSTSCIGTICLPFILSAAHAQQASSSSPPQAEIAGEDEPSIVVTGSRIRSPNLTSNVPTATFQVNEILSSGSKTIGDALTALPSLRPTVTNASSGRDITTAGLNLLDLRGLGTVRTLVLTNGRRHITSQAGDFGVDINTIPTDLIERVDIVTGGNSAVYGSDAVAGVVNFVLKRKFEGVRLRAQSGISDEGDRGTQLLSLTAGRNFSENRGNIAVNLEYSRARTLSFTDRDNQTGAFSGRQLFNNTQNTGPNLNPSAGAIRNGAEPAGGDGISDTSFLTVRNNNISDGGLYTASCPTVAAIGETNEQFLQRRAAACSGTPNPASSNPLTQLGKTYVFLPDGTLTANTCSQDLRQFNSTTCVGGLGSTLRRTGLLQPGVKRKMINLLASYEFSEAFRPFLEAKYVSIDSVRSGQPSFFNNSFNINNPFLATQARDLLATTLAPGQTTFSALRFNVDFGAVSADISRETFRVVAGAEGKFNNDWSYEVAFNYGRLHTNLSTGGNVLLARYANAINAVRNANGQIACSINADGNPANDDPACVPVNVFGYGQPSQAALSYFGHTSTRSETAAEYNIVADISGDSSDWFELPAGPLSFVVGGEYRREEARSASDAITRQIGATFLSLGPAFNPPAYEIKEAFAEVHAPLLADRPFFHELSFDASGRVSNYNLGSTGTVLAYNLGLIWAPARDIRFRGGYARSVRAPTLTNLYLGSSPVLGTLGLADPCGQQNINNNPNRARNCAAAGVPTTQTFSVNGVSTTEPFTNRPVAAIMGATSGNINLREESGTSITLGAVIQPKFVPNLSLSIDYYNVKIKNAIASLDSQTQLNLCYDAPAGIDNAYCNLIFRNPNGTFLGQTSVNHAGAPVALTSTGFSYIQQPFNFAKTETSGIDVDLAYKFDVTDGVIFDFRLLASYIIKRNNFTNINNPTFSNRQKSELGDPAWRGQFFANLETGIFKVSYSLQYIGKQTIAAEYETQNSYQNRAPLNPDAFPKIWFPAVLYHNFRLGADITDHFNLYAGVDNAFDRLPPYNIVTGDSAIATGSSPYDNIGRYFYVGVTAKF